MSEYIFKLPDLGEGTVEAEIVEWHVQPGDSVTEGDIIADVMTDKANVEVPAPVSGTVLRTSGAPGCTRAINIFRVRLRTNDDEAHLDLVDLPVYGYAQRSKAERKSWGPLIEGFLSERAGLRGAVVIIDIRRGAQDDDIQLLEFLQSVGVTPILVATKIDKLPTSKRKPAVAKLQRGLDHQIIPYSSVTGDGWDALWRRVLSVSSIDRPAESTPT